MNKDMVKQKKDIGYTFLIEARELLKEAVVAVESSSNSSSQDILRLKEMVEQNKDIDYTLLRISEEIRSS